VCINPVWVAHATACLTGSGVGVCTVIAFPFGAALSELKALEARTALANGATEVDMVINIGALKAAELDLVSRDIAGVVAVCRESRRADVVPVIVKVIIETGLLTDDQKASACTVAQSAGADYVKTSTGFGPSGATPNDVALMRRVVGWTMGVKAAGGVRDLSAFETLLAAGASRIGTSAGVAIVREHHARSLPYGGHK
jgi:deoxyribose-phosphate aldolase